MNETVWDTCINNFKIRLLNNDSCFYLLNEMNLHEINNSEWNIFIRFLSIYFLVSSKQSD